LGAVVPPGGLFLLNMKDHERAGRRQCVSAWHVEVLCSLGFALLWVEDLPGPRGIRHGSNHDARYPEQLWVLRRQADRML
jgi:hypothetical protein